jgi:phage-related protein
MLPLSSNAIIEKNKINSSETWLLLLEINYENESPIYLCLNNETVTWPSAGGNDYLPAIFNLSGIVETKDGETPSIPLTIFDLNRTLIPILEEYDGGIGAEVIIRVVHSAYLNNATPEFEESTEIIDVSIDSKAQVTFKLGAEDLRNRVCPLQRYLKNNCRFIFKKAQLSFTSGGTNEIEVGQYIQGDTSSDQAKILKVKLTSGSFAGGDAAGTLIILTIDGPFQAENISLYSDSGFTSLVQSNVATISGASEGRCGYTGSETDCNRSFVRCEELSNETRNGGFIGVANTGFLK